MVNQLSRVSFVAIEWKVQKNACPRSEVSCWTPPSTLSPLISQPGMAGRTARTGRGCLLGRIQWGRSLNPAEPLFSFHQGLEGQGGPPSGALGRWAPGAGRGREDPHLEPWGGGPQGWKGQGEPPSGALGQGPQGLEGQGGPPSGALGRGPQGLEGQGGPPSGALGQGPQGLEGQGGPPSGALGQWAPGAGRGREDPRLEPSGGGPSSSTRLEALVPSRDSRARTRSPSPRAWRPDFPGAAREAP